MFCFTCNWPLSRSQVYKQNLCPLFALYLQHTQTTCSYMLHYEVVRNSFYKGNLTNAWTCVVWEVAHLYERTVGNPLLLLLIMIHCTISMEMITVVCPTFWYLWTHKVLLESSTRILCLSLVCFPVKVTLHQFDVRSLITTSHFNCQYQHMHNFNVTG